MHRRRNFHIAEHQTKKLLLIILICTLVLLICAMIRSFMQRGGSAGGVGQSSTETHESRPGSLAMPEDLNPHNLITGREPDILALEDDEGRQIRLTDYGKPVWCLVFASWCPDCEEQLKISDEIQKAADDYGVQLVFIDRLNEEKESITAALAKLQEHRITAPCLFDRDEVLYSSWGFQEIPSQAVLSADGKVLGYAHGVMTEGECRGLLEGALNGKAEITKRAVMEHLSAESEKILRPGSSAAQECLPCQGPPVLTFWQRARA